MTYSNTNKDRGQPRGREKLKKIVIPVILVMIILSTWTNIVQQAITLKEAEKQNQKIEQKLKALEEENKKLEWKIATATSSSEIQRNIRQNFGLGTDEDRWLAVDLEPSETNKTGEKAVEESQSVLQQWWNLFTR